MQYPHKAELEWLGATVTISHKPRGAILVKHVFIGEQKMRERVFFHTLSRTACRIAISFNFGKKGILFSSTSQRLGYEFQIHESSLYLPPFCRLLWHFYTFSHKRKNKKCNKFFYVGNSFWKTGQCLGPLFSYDMQKGCVCGRSVKRIAFLNEYLW